MVDALPDLSDNVDAACRVTTVRAWLPPCATCSHPFADHTVGVGKPATKPNCTQCPHRCSYVYPYPLCRACGEPAELYVVERKGWMYHVDCLRKEASCQDPSRDPFPSDSTASTTTSPS